MDEDRYNELERFLHDHNPGTYIKAENVDVRVHLIGLFAGQIDLTNEQDTVIESLRALETYTKYG